MQSVFWIFFFEQSVCTEHKNSVTSLCGRRLSVIYYQTLAYLLIHCHKRVLYKSASTSLFDLWGSPSGFHCCTNAKTPVNEVVCFFFLVYTYFIFILRFLPLQLTMKLQRVLICSTAVIVICSVHEVNVFNSLI